MLSGKVTFKCSNVECQEVMHVNSSDFDIDCTWSDENRGMGQENGYEGNITINCPACGEEIEVKYEYTEYPIGSPNFEDGPNFNKEVTVLENTLTIY